MSGVGQAVFMNQRSFALKIGDAYQGGFFAGQIGVSGVATHNLVVSPLSSGQTTGLFKTTNTTDPGALSVIDGPANSSSMNDADHPAAQFCESRTIGGFSDWYMPAKNELDVCYFNLKPDTTSNDTTVGTNTNAVPSRGSNYTAGNPAQTAATDFIAGGSQAFTSSPNAYWSSTQMYASDAFAQRFSTGAQTGYGKAYNPTTRVRCIRRVAV